MPYHAEWEALYDQEIYAVASLFLLTIYFYVHASTYDANAI